MFKSLCVPLVAQESAERYSDSLVHAVRLAATNALKIEGLLQVSLFWSDRDTARAFQFLNEARELMGNKPDAYHDGLYQLYLANIYAVDDEVRAKELYVKADSLLSRYTTPQAYRYRSKVWNNYGIILQKEDKIDEFMEVVVDKALPFARLAGDSASVGYQLINMGLLLDNINDYQKARGYFISAIQTVRDLPNSEETKLEVFTNLARNAIFRRDFDDARVNLDSAGIYAALIPHSTYAPNFHYVSGRYHRFQRNKQQAIKSFDEGIATATKLNDEYALRNIHFERSKLHREFGEYEKAKQALSIADRYSPFPSLHNDLLHRREMAELEFELRNYKAAFLEMMKFAEGLDSLHNMELELKVIGLEKKFQTIEKENQILRLQDENQKQQLAIANSKRWKLAGAAGVLLALCIAIFSWRLYKNKQAVLEQHKKLHAEELKSIQQQQRLKQYDSMIQGQELERNRLARDLHDGLGGLLAGVKLKLSSIASRSNGKSVPLADSVDDVIAQLDYSVDELRRISRNMMPEALLSMGLNAALADLCKLMSTAQTSAQFEPLKLRTAYPKPFLIAVYRIIQELLTNAVKHSGATGVILQCSELENWLFITVEDNGKGMATPKKSEQKGIGLDNIHNRVELLNGKIEFVSEKGQGTAVHIQIPVP